ncbi:hypothetical protein A33Q_0828 [Indibacter alkaliphilus LW1]|uniref:Uncharacterized protein n=1 Tax=Indibacter alkaliphilus (strain CCUG 57479 / KCTC 22604 / LW1) TaxID=1189612 RepID=S2DJ04_INDAL|nr:hypothetical protein A33Q_0828 [Indibacter alkaliphilus LW1]
MEIGLGQSFCEGWIKQSGSLLISIAFMRWLKLGAQGYRL